MDYKYIEQLTERYFAAETTLSEEQILRSFFEQNHDTLPAELQQYAALFTALQPEEHLGDDFDERLLAMTEEHDTPVVKARVVSLADRLRPLFGAAAVVAILLTLGSAINLSFRNVNKEVETEQYAGYHVQKNGEPATAYEQTNTIDSIKLVPERLNQVLTKDSLKSLSIN